MYSNMNTKHVYCIVGNLGVNLLLTKVNILKSNKVEKQFGSKNGSPL
jgi:hypothetical protein